VKKEVLSAVVVENKKGEAKMRNLALMWVLAGVAVALLAAGDGKPSVSTFTDKRDGKVYKIVKIGSQTWFAENLNYAAKGSVCYNNDTEYCEVCGRLYKWSTAKQSCPAGWHLPEIDEWAMLENFVGDSLTAGTKLKSVEGWWPNTYWRMMYPSMKNWNDATNEYGFSALACGDGFGDSSFSNTAGRYGLWWSTTERDTNNVFYLTMSFNEEKVGRHYAYKTNLRSVRCVQDDEKERRK
jgi:uncharacterized protein (TIGR02145 family)